MTPWAPHAPQTPFNFDPFHVLIEGSIWNSWHQSSVKFAPTLIEHNERGKAIWSFWCIHIVFCMYTYLRLFWTLFDPRLFYLVPPNIIEMKLRYSFSTIRITYMWHNNWSSIFCQTCNPDVYKLYSAQKIEKILCKNKMYEHWKWIRFSETALFLKLF